MATKFYSSGLIGTQDDGNKCKTNYLCNIEHNALWPLCMRLRAKSKRKQEGLCLLTKEDIKRPCNNAIWV